MSPTTWSQQLLPWIILVFCLIEYSLNETASPQNHAAANGAQVQLNCSWPKKDEVMWSLDNLIDGKENRIPIYYENKMVELVKDRFKVDDSSEGNFNLLFNASKSNSGTFTCPTNVLAGDTGSQSAQVIVLDPRPECSREYETGGVKAKCSIGFSGYWSPKLEWLNASVTLEPKYINVTKTTQNSLVNSAATVPFNEAPYNLTCTPKFTLENIPPETTAKNIPEYPTSCTVTIGPKPTVTTEPPKPTLKQPSNAQSKGDNDTKYNTGDSVSAHNWHSLYLCQCFAASVLIGMLHKWLGQ